MSDRHKVFISYHHENDQHYKEILIAANQRLGLFIDGSVDTGEIDEGLDDETIRKIIRDDYLRDTTVTIVLVGTETARRKHVDWEIYSSMYDGAVNKKSGILVINLPTVGSTTVAVAHGDDEKIIYPNEKSWIPITAWDEWKRRFPYVPDRIIDNLARDNGKVSITNWDSISDNVEKLRLLIELAYRDRASADYDLSRPMRRNNS